MEAEDIPDDENGDVLRRMLSNGDSLKAPRDIDFSIVFPDEKHALVFCQQIATEGFEVRYEKSDTTLPSPWDVTATRHMVPRHSEITAVERHLQSLAAPLGGQIDGWGCFNVMDRRE